MRITIEENNEFEHSHAFACIMLLILICSLAIDNYLLQRDVNRLYTTTQSLDNENAVQAEAIHRIVERMNKND